MALRDEQRIVVPEQVLSRAVDGEAVLLDLESGTYFGLNEVGSEIWELLARGANVAEIRTELLQRFEVDRATLDADLDKLVAELERRGLIRIEG